MTRVSTKGPLGLKDRTGKADKPRKPMRRQSRKKVAHRASDAGHKDAWYKGQVRNLPCCVCVAYGLKQTSPTDAHHPICERHSTERVPDRECIPLCKCHHQGLRFDRDKTKLAIHQGKESWVAAYRSDREYIAATQDAILGEVE